MLQRAILLRAATGYKRPSDTSGPLSPVGPALQVGPTAGLGCTRMETPDLKVGRYGAVDRGTGAYSYRKASIGSSREALKAGNNPKKMPTLAEKPIPRANDHQGRDTGKPDSQ
jgi:hypothetical protein